MDGWDGKTVNLSMRTLLFVERILKSFDASFRSFVRSRIYLISCLQNPSGRCPFSGASGPRILTMDSDLSWMWNVLRKLEWRRFNWRGPNSVAVIVSTFKAKRFVLVDTCIMVYITMDSRYGTKKLFYTTKMQRFGNLSADPLRASVDSSSQTCNFVLEGVGAILEAMMT